MEQNIRNRYRWVRRRLPAFAILAAGILCVWLMAQRGLLVESRAGQARQELEGKVFRLHVLADSDLPSDQQVKMQVKEQVVEWLAREMGETDSAGETKAFIGEHLGELRSLAEETVREAGSRDPVTAEIVTDDFPEKTYGDVTFPAGEYEALRIRIGSGSGHNWWCCLYPGLCFTDAVCGEVAQKDKEKLRQVLDGDTYDMITSTTNYKIKWFFFGEP